jgi:hypothetical protein
MPSALDESSIWATVPTFYIFDYTGLENRLARPQARALCLEIREGWHHVTTRGNERQAIFRHDRDLRCFLDSLGEAWQRPGLVSRCLSGFSDRVVGRLRTHRQPGRSSLRLPTANSQDWGKRSRP